MTPDQGRARPAPPPGPEPRRSSTPPAPVTAGSGDVHSDLGSALEQLDRVSAGAPSWEASLDRVVALTVAAVPAADGVGITVQDATGRATVCVSDPFVRAVDEVQYDLDEGPCVTAVAEGRTVGSGSLGDDPAFPRFGPRARGLGVRSALSLPLLTREREVLGALNVYGRRPDAFATGAAVRGEAFAAAAAVVVDNAREIVQARRLVGQLRAAMTSRATIDQAIGILMSRQGGNPDDAFATLKRLSQNQNIKLAVVAEEIVREAVTRARARHGGG